MPKRPARDPHAVLGLEPGAARAEIQRAFRDRARQLHPDVSGTDTTAAMAALSAARDELLAHAPGDAPPRRPGSATPPPAPDAKFDGAWDDYWSSWWSFRKDGD